MIDQSLIAVSSIKIEASASKIWEVLTHPNQIKIYLFGTNVLTDWKEGSPIVFKGNYQGTEYTDKGNVIKNVLNTLLKYNYWSGFSGLEDLPENYAVVTYTIKALKEGVCEFSWHQQGFSSEDGKCHTEEGLKNMLQEIKKLSEA